MRVELTDDEARRIRSAIECYCVETCAPTDYRDRLLALFTPVERLTAGLAPARGGPPDEHAIVSDDVMVGETMVPTCPRCGGQEIGYYEGCTNYIQPGEADPDETGGMLRMFTRGWDDIGDSYDGDPGLFCDDILGGGCGAPIDLPEGWEIAWE